MLQKVLVLIFVLYRFSLTLCGKCPPEELLLPCICDNNTIKCGGNQALPLWQIFRDISLNLVLSSDKSFDTFILENTAITELVDNTFHDITFKKILLNNTNKLKRISPRAFELYNMLSIEEFKQLGETELGSDLYVRELFDALNSLVNIRSIDFDETLIQSIPEHAFNLANGLQNQLTHISFNSFNKYEGRIKSVGNYAFYFLNNLTYLFLGTSMNLTNKIPIHAFDFQQSSNNTLLIELGDNNITDKNIEIGAFTNAKRPIELHLGTSRYNPLLHIDEKVFGPILRVDKRNCIAFNGIKLECDCRMHWLFRDKEQYKSQIIWDFKCKDGKDFWSLTERHFDACNEI